MAKDSNRKNLHKINKLKQNTDSYKLKQKQYQQRFQRKQEDDDESGGGSGKRMQGSFKLEKLLGVIEKGRMKAQNFWRFLSKEGLDSHETKKSTLDRIGEKAEKVTEHSDKQQEVSESQERAQELLHEQQEEQTADSGKDAYSWERSESKSESKTERANVSDNANAADTGNRIFSTVRDQTQSSRDISGSRVQGASHAQAYNHLGGTVNLFNYLGADAKTHQNYAGITAATKAANGYGAAGNRNSLSASIARASTQQSAGAAQQQSAATSNAVKTSGKR